MERQYEEPARSLAAREYDVVVAGGGTAGAVAALAAARHGAKTALIEMKGYTGGIAVEGGTALHSFYNLWKAFPGVEKRQVVRGIPQEIVDRLAQMGGTSGHAEMLKGYDYDSVCTAIDTELYKLATMQLLAEAGVSMLLNTFVAGAIAEGPQVRGVLAESRSGREAVFASAFVDCTGYGDLAAAAGAEFTEPNDYDVANSMGVGGMSIDKLYDFLVAHDALTEYSEGPRDGRQRAIRVSAAQGKLPRDFLRRAGELGLWLTTTTLHDDYLMFVKLNVRMPVSPTDRDAAAAAELELRRRQAAAIKLFREFIPGCDRAFIARTSPSLCIRRGRVICCDYDIKLDDVLGAKHFDDEVMVYGFHDAAPRFQVGRGDTYGVPYRALRVSGFDNLLAAGMMITSDHDAHMSTRNTVCCMGQGEAAGTAAALCAAKKCGTRELESDELREALAAAGVCLEG